MPDVRFTGVDEKHKYYRSRVTAKKNEQRYQPLLEQVLYWRARLLLDKRDLLVRFLEEFAKN